MKYDCTVNVRGREFKFESLDDDEPLRYIITIDDKNFLIRDINCDIPYEKWTLVNKYTSVKNGLEKDDTFSSQVYHGRDIEDENFMKQLLENVLFEFLIGDEDIRTAK